MPFGLTPEILAGPVSALIVALVFAGVMYKLVNRLLGEFKQANQTMSEMFQAEITSCEKRYSDLQTLYQQLLNEIFRLKDKDQK